jgi:hypothetical protein
VAESCEDGNKTLGAVKGVEFVDVLCDIQLLRDSAIRNWV